MKGLYWAALGVVLMGLVFFGVGFGIQLSDDQLLAVAETTEGTLELYGAETALVAYEVDGQAYRGESSVYVSSMRSGEAVTVSYDPERPERFTTPYVRRFTALFRLIGLCIAGLGAALALIAFLKGQADRSLLENGKTLEARVTAVRTNTHVQMTGRGCPSRIYATYTDPDTGEAYTFRSPNLWGDPSKMAKLQTVAVSVSPLNYKRYVMDVPEELARFDKDRLHQPLT